MSKKKRLLIRFWSKIRKTKTCWLWVAGTNNGGYGSFQVNGEPTSAHKFSYELYVGSVPGGLCVLHECDNPSCVNPKHLFLGTQKDNLRDAFIKGKIVCGDNHWSRLYPEKIPRGEKHGSHTHPESRPRGEKHGRAKLRLRDVQKIRRLCATGKHSQKVLGQIFNVSQSHISRIVNHTKWRKNG